MSRLRPDTVTRRIERIADQAQQRSIALIEAYMRQVAEEWQAAHPRRAVRFIDAMGTHGWLVDDEWLSHAPGHKAEDERWQAVMKPLLDAHDWYTNAASILNVTIEDLSLESEVTA